MMEIMMKSDYQRIRSLLNESTAHANDAYIQHVLESFKGNISDEVYTTRRNKSTKGESNGND